MKVTFEKFLAFLLMFFLFGYFSIALYGFYLNKTVRVCEVRGIIRLNGNDERFIGNDYKNITFECGCYKQADRQDLCMIKPIINNLNKNEVEGAKEL